MGELYVVEASGACKLQVADEPPSAVVFFEAPAAVCAECVNGCNFLEAVFLVHVAC